MTEIEEYYLKVKRSWADKRTSTEVDASSLVRTFLDNKGWEYREQYLIRSMGTYLDFLVKAPYEDGYIFFGIECKRLLGYATKATQFADYVEQAGAYAKYLELPIFLGPYINQFCPSELYSGGSLSPVSAASIFGGRFNVGIMGYNNRYSVKIDVNNPCFILRGDIFWYNDKFNPRRLNVVKTTGSKKIRVPLKVYKQKSKVANEAIL